MNKDFAQDFGRDWVAAWNSHNLDNILAHYSEDFEMTSPIILQLMNEPSGTLKGKAAVRAYWAKALAKIPDLHFELLYTCVGINSVVVCYKGHRGVSAEVLQFDADGKVTRAYAHYD